MKINWRYAIGEVIIVIIGISIAFGLNKTWQDRKDRKVEKTYLDGLTTDLQKDHDALNRNLGRFDKNLSKIKHLRPHLYRELPGRDTVARMFFELAEMISFFPNSGTYDALINSGDLKLISNAELRTALEDHYNFYEILEYEETRLLNFHKTYLSDFMIYKVDFDKVFRGDNSFLDQKVTPNLLNTMFGIFSLGREKTEEGLERTEKLLMRMQAESNSAKTRIE